MKWLKKLASLLGMAHNKDDCCTSADAIEFDIAVGRHICTCPVIKEHQELSQQKPVIHILTSDQTHLA